MLRIFRVIFASIFFALFLVLFLDFTGVIKPYLACLAKLQLVPALLAHQAIALAIIALLTLLFGRLYCSILCPLGLYQDAVSKLRRKRNPYKFRKANNVLRVAFLLIFSLALAFGVGVVVAVLEPYSSFGLILANITEFRGWISFGVALALLALVTVLAIRDGRAYCNNICPVGTFLGIFSRYSVFKPVINTDKCINCGKCGKNCKGECIDTKEHKIDYSRCVACFDCLENCSVKAIDYKCTWGRSAAKASEPVAPKSHDASKRAFMATAAALLAQGTVLKAAEAIEEVVDDGKKRDGGFAPITPKKRLERTTPITPFGSESVDEFYAKCLSCHLCITACPNGVLKPSTDLKHLLQPEMTFEKGYCRPECTKCSEVCPSGSIVKITPEEKTTYKVGLAKIDYSACLPNSEDVKCGNCARHCPVGAIMMVKKNPDDEHSIRIPAVNEDRCIGCGACENLCPVSPISAIVVNGVQDHRRD